MRFRHIVFLSLFTSMRADAMEVGDVLTNEQRNFQLKFFEMVHYIPINYIESTASQFSPTSSFWTNITYFNAQIDGFWQNWQNSINNKTYNNMTMKAFFANLYPNDPDFIKNATIGMAKMRCEEFRPLLKFNNGNLMDFADDFFESVNDSTGFQLRDLAQNPPNNWNTNLTWPSEEQINDYWNQKQSIWKNYTSSGFSGQTFADLVFPNDPNGLENFVKKIMRQRAWESYEKWLDPVKVAQARNDQLLAPEVETNFATTATTDVRTYFEQQLSISDNPLAWLQAFVDAPAQLQTENAGLWNQLADYSYSSTFGTMNIGAAAGILHSGNASWVEDEITRIVAEVAGLQEMHDRAQARNDQLLATEVETNFATTATTDVRAYFEQQLSVLDNPLAWLQAFVDTPAQLQTENAALWNQLMGYAYTDDTLGTMNIGASAGILHAGNGTWVEDEITRIVAEVAGLQEMNDMAQARNDQLLAPEVETNFVTTATNDVRAYFEQQLNISDNPLAWLQAFVDTPAQLQTENAGLWNQLMGYAYTDDTLGTMNIGAAAGILHSENGTWVEDEITRIVSEVAGLQEMNDRAQARNNQLVLAQKIGTNFATTASSVTADSESVLVATAVQSVKSPVIQDKPTAVALNQTIFVQKVTDNFVMPMTQQSNFQNLTAKIVSNSAATTIADNFSVMQQELALGDINASKFKSLGFDFSSELTQSSDMIATSVSLYSSIRTPNASYATTDIQAEIKPETDGSPVVALSQPSAAKAVKNKNISTQKQTGTSTSQEMSAPNKKTAPVMGHKLIQKQPTKKIPVNIPPQQDKVHAFATYQEKWHSWMQFIKNWLVWQKN